MAVLAAERARFDAIRRGHVYSALDARSVRLLGACGIWRNLPSVGIAIAEPKTLVRRVPSSSPAETDVQPTADPLTDAGPPPDEPASVSRGGERVLLGSWRVWAGLVISAGFLFYAFRGQNLSEVWATLRGADLRWLPPALALYFAGVWVRAMRWSVLLRPVVATRARTIFPIVVVGYTANNVLPLRTGELVRAYLLGQRYGVRKTTALATIAVERLFDGLTMLGFLLAATTVISFTAELQHLAIIAFAVFAVVLLGLVIITLGGDLRDRLLQLVLGPLPTRIADRVERLAGSFLSGLAVFTRKADLTLVALTSVIAWGFEASMYWMIARGFDSELRTVLGVAAALLTTGVANLWTLIPAAPGYVGTFEAGVQLAVHDVLGVSRGVALSYAILVHAALWFPITLLGVIEWWRQHLSLRQARKLNGPPAVGEDYATVAPLPTAPATPNGHQDGEPPPVVIASREHADRAR